MKTIVALVDFSDVTFKVLKQAHTLAKALVPLERLVEEPQPHDDDSQANSS